MKRVRVLFTAFMVLALVAGALAFKAQSFDTTIGYCSSTSGGTCALQLNRTFSTNTSHPTLFCTSDQTANACTILTTYTENP